MCYIQYFQKYSMINVILNTNMILRFFFLPNIPFIRWAGNGHHNGPLRPCWDQPPAPRFSFYPWFRYPINHTHCIKHHSHPLLVLNNWSLIHSSHGTWNTTSVSLSCAVPLRSFSEGAYHIFVGWYETRLRGCDIKMYFNSTPWISDWVPHGLRREGGGGGGSDRFRWLAQLETRFYWKDERKYENLLYQLLWWFKAGGVLILRATHTIYVLRWFTQSVSFQWITLNLCHLNNTKFVS